MKGTGTEETGYGRGRVLKGTGTELGGRRRVLKG